jgi:hypothetical protein
MGVESPTGGDCYMRTSRTPAREACWKHSVSLTRLVPQNDGDLGLGDPPLIAGCRAVSAHDGGHPDIRGRLLVEQLLPLRSLACR